MMGSPTAELARKLMNKEANKLAKELQNHKPEDVEVLVKAATSFLEGPYHRTDEQYIALQSALAKFAPKPAKVYVLPEWKTFYEAQEMRYSSHWDGDYVTVDINARDKNKNPISVNEDRYNVIRELTALSQPEPM